jgi:hypothetical protein
MEDADLTDDNLLSDKMKISLHMLGALMLNGVGGEVHDADVVAVDKDAPRRWGLKFVEQLSQPSGLSHTVGNGTILGLNAVAGDDDLPLGRLGNQVVPQEHRIAWRRAANVWTTGPVSVRVDDEVRAARKTQKKIVVWRPLKIAQDALHDRQMGLSRVVHVQTYLLHDVGNVGPCECQLLESSCNAPELRDVLNGRLQVSRQLCLKVEWCHAWLAVRHDYTFEDVKHVGALMEKQTSRTMLDGDAEEVVKRPEVLHGKFPLKSENGMTQELRAVCGHDDIINIK